MKLKHTLFNQKIIVVLLFFCFPFIYYPLYAQSFVKWQKVQSSSQIKGIVNLDDGHEIAVIAKVSSSEGLYYTGRKNNLIHENIISTIEGKLPLGKVRYKQGFVYPKTYEEAKLTHFNEMFETKKSPRCKPTVLTFTFSEPVQIKELFIGDLDAVQMRYLGCGTERLYYINSHDESFSFSGVDFSGVSPGEMLEQDYKPYISTQSVRFRKPSKVLEDRNGYDYVVFTNSTNAVLQFQIIFSGWEQCFAECPGKSGLVSRSNALNYFAMKIGNFTVPCGVSVPKTTTPQIVCRQEKPIIADLRASGTNLKWYRRITGGLPLNMDEKLVEGQKYFVSQTLSGCESERVGVRVLFHTPVTTKKILGEHVVCIDSPTSFNVSDSKNGKWSSSDETILIIGDNGKAIPLKSGSVMIHYKEPLEEDKWCDSLWLQKRVIVKKNAQIPTVAFIESPSCKETKGAIAIHSQDDVLYSIDDKKWQESNYFFDVVPGRYSLYAKKVGSGCKRKSINQVVVREPSPLIAPPTLDAVAGDNVIDIEEKQSNVLLSGRVDTGLEVMVYWGTKKKKAVVENNRWVCTFSSEELPDFKKSIIVVEAIGDNCRNATARIIQNIDALGGATILAVDDDFSHVPVSFLEGREYVGNILWNDKIMDMQVEDSEVLLKLQKVFFEGKEIAPSLSPVKINSQGIVSVVPQAKKGNYELVYMICDKFVPMRCDTASVFITVNGNCKVLLQNLRIPRFLSCNGDGKNECWEFSDLLLYEKSCGYKANKLYLINRLGEIVYEKEDYMLDDERFCGAKKEKMLSSGFYFFILEIEGENEIRTGVLYLKNAEKIEGGNLF